MKVDTVEERTEDAHRSWTVRGQGGGRKKESRLKRTAREEEGSHRQHVLPVGS